MEVREQSRYIKSYKYKHKKPEGEIKSSSCDCARPELSFSSSQLDYYLWPPARRRRRRQSMIMAPAGSYMIIFIMSCLLIMQQLAQQSLAFCPSKCLCNDQLLSANCTHVGSISIVPMTLNPLLKRLTLNHLPLFELSNSLSVYRQLDYLNLSSNQLKQIKYENFNFKPAPNSVLLHHPSANNFKQMANSNSELNSNNQQLARHLKQSIDKSLSEDQEEEIGFHLRHLDLADNRIEQLGSLSELDLIADEIEQSQQSNRRLKALDLERLAPFLSLTRLQKLSLARNRLSKLHQHVFLGLMELKELDLSANSIEFVDERAFVGLIELEQLRLDNNRIARHLHQLSLSFCRAPMNELRWLDLSDNQQSLITYSDQQQNEISLPNQMFICVPKLTRLKLNGLQLRYIQANAFDNLQQLASLNLSRNNLEQVPKDSLSYSSSNLSLTLTELDLSDTLIEFVNANSFGSLRQLQKLCMNSMRRLVSFDLAALSIRHSDTQRNRLARGSGQLDSALRSLLPNHLFERVQGEFPAAQEQQQLAYNDQLIELQLKHNHRLQSVHSSLASGSGKRIRFTRLRLLALTGAKELSELALEAMLELDGPEAELSVDVSQVSRLNCSSCQMSWLISAARRLRAASSDLRLQLFDANQFKPNPSNNRLALVSPGLIGCAWPMDLPLLQLLDLETPFAPIFGDQCSQKWAPALHLAGQVADELQTNLNSPQPTRDTPSADLATPLPEASGAAGGSAALAVLLCLMLISVGAKLVVSLMKRRGAQSTGFKWRSPSLATSLSSPVSSQNNSQSGPDCSSSSILSTQKNLLYGKEALARDIGQSESKGAFQLNGHQLILNNVDQIERVHRRANLFSRLKSRLSADPRAWQLPTSSSSMPNSSLEGAIGSQGKGSHIIRNAVYGGDKMLARYCAAIQVSSSKSGQDEPSCGIAIAVNQGPTRRTFNELIKPPGQLQFTSSSSPATAHFLPISRAQSKFLANKLGSDTHKESTANWSHQYQLEDAKQAQLGQLASGDRLVYANCDLQEAMIDPLGCRMQLEAIKTDPCRLSAAEDPFASRLATCFGATCSQRAIKAIGAGREAKGFYLANKGEEVQFSALEQKAGGQKTTNRDNNKSNNEEDELDDGHCEPLEGHIYVTLDGPIKQVADSGSLAANCDHQPDLKSGMGPKQESKWRSGSEFEEEFESEQQEVGSLKGKCLANRSSGKQADDYKSFEWSSTSTVGDVLSSSQWSEKKQALKIGADKFKLEPSKQFGAGQLGKLSGNFLAEQPFDKSANNRQPTIESEESAQSGLFQQHRQLRQDIKVSGANLQTKIYDKNGSDLALKSRKLAIKQDSPSKKWMEEPTKSNVTDHLSSGARNEQSGGRQMGAAGGQWRAAESLSGFQLDAGEDPAQRLAVTSKYDANHDARAANNSNNSARPFDGDYVINGSRHKQRQKQRPHSQLMGGSNPEARDLIGQQAESGGGECKIAGSAARQSKVSQHAPLADHRLALIKQTNDTDYLVGSGHDRTTARQTNERFRGTVISSALDGHERGSSPQATNHNEIYSNQFYYCKPNSHTLTRKRDHINPGISPRIERQIT